MVVPVEPRQPNLNLNNNAEIISDDFGFAVKWMTTFLFFFLGGGTFVLMIQFRSKFNAICVFRIKRNVELCVGS